MTVRLLALALLFAAPPASASVVLKQSIEEMTRTADLVVRGTVGKSSARWNSERTGIETWTDLSIKEVLKGSTDGAVWVRQPGGELDGVGQQVSGAAAFRPGEEVVLFLEKAPDFPHSYFVLSLAYGKIQLEKTALGDHRAFRDSKGLALYAPSSPPEVRELRRREDLGPSSDFLARIRRAAKGQGSKAKSPSPGSEP